MSSAPTATYWLSSIGGVAAALAFGFGVFTYWRQGEARKQDQANRVSAWLVATHPPAVQSGVRILNSSGRAVYDCKVLVTEADGDPVMLFRGSAIDYFASATLPVVPPGEQMRVFDGELAVTPDHAGVEIVFRDQANQHWRRTTRGDLHRLTPDEARVAHVDLASRPAPRPE